MANRSDRRRSGWSATVEEFDPLPPGKRLFFENLGFRVLRFRRAKDLYDRFFDELSA